MKPPRTRPETEKTSSSGPAPKAPRRKRRRRLDAAADTEAYFWQQSRTSLGEAVAR